MRNVFAPDEDVVIAYVEDEHDTEWWDALCEAVHAREIERTELPPLSAPIGGVDGW